jgi:hypothetical protein
MRVRVSDPTFLQDLCDFLSRRGYLAVEVSEEEAEVLIPGAGSGFEAAAMVRSEVGIWRVKRAGVRVAVEGQAAAAMCPPDRAVGSCGRFERSWCAG